MPIYKYIDNIKIGPDNLGEKVAIKCVNEYKFSPQFLQGVEENFFFLKWGDSTHWFESEF